MWAFIVLPISYHRVSNAYEYIFNSCRLSRCAVLQNSLIVACALLCRTFFRRLFLLFSISLVFPSLVLVKHLLSSAIRISHSPPSLRWSYLVSASFFSSPAIPRPLTSRSVFRSYEDYVIVYFLSSSWLKPPSRPSVSSSSLRDCRFRRITPPFHDNLLLPQRRELTSTSVTASFPLLLSLIPSRVKYSVTSSRSCFIRVAISNQQTPSSLEATWWSVSAFEGRGKKRKVRSAGTWKPKFVRGKVIARLSSVKLHLAWAKKCWYPCRSRRRPATTKAPSNSLSDKYHVISRKTHSVQCSRNSARFTNSPFSRTSTREYTRVRFQRKKCGICCVNKLGNIAPPLSKNL